MTVYSSGNAAGLHVQVDTAGLDRQMTAAPRVVYFWLRNFLGATFGKHRQEWLRAKGVKFGRGGGGGRAIKVWPVNQGPAVPGPSDVTYQVTPAAVRQDSERAAVAGLQQLAAEAHTGSLVLQVHEFGATIQGRRMAVPVRTRPGTPAAWRQANPGKVLVLRKGRGDVMLLYERLRSAGRGRPAKNGKARRKVVERLRLRFLLVRRVTNRPTLHMYDTWGRLSGYRATAWRQARERIEQALAKGKTS